MRVLSQAHCPTIPLMYPWLLYYIIIIIGCRCWKQRRMVLWSKQIALYCITGHSLSKGKRELIFSIFLSCVFTSQPTLTLSPTPSYFLPPTSYLLPSPSHCLSSLSSPAAHNHVHFRIYSGASRVQNCHGVWFLLPQHGWCWRTHLLSLSMFVT